MSVPNLQMQAALLDGLNVLDLNQSVTFQAYSRVVLPLDGYIFWSPTSTLTVQGSLHYGTVLEQTEDETFGNSSVTFTTGSPVSDFLSAPPSTIYVAIINGFRFAFSTLNYYLQAGLYHYTGRSIQPAFAAQLLDQPGMLDNSQPVVNNSLPIWLSFNNWTSPWSDGFSNSIPLYPSFLTPPNIEPAYAAVHIEPTQTRGLHLPALDLTRNHQQSAVDLVRVTLYGLQANQAADFLDFVIQYATVYPGFGLMNIPVIMDGKRNQIELQALAMQKVIEFQISYTQTRVADVARQMIESAKVFYALNPLINNVIVTQAGQDIDTQGNQYLQPQTGGLVGDLGVGAPLDTQSGSKIDGQNNLGVGVQ